MSADIRRPLSSPCLYHFKKDATVLKLILRNGFSHRLLRETIPYKHTEQQNFLVCFCDMRWEDSRRHRDCYGENAIVLTKQWGIHHGVSPVRYIHETSPGADTHYIAVKNMLRLARLSAGTNRAHLIQDLLTTSILKDQGVLRIVSSATSLALDPAIAPTADTIDDEFQDFLKGLGQTQASRFVNYLGSLVQRIAELDNELEFRDSFTRRYQEDFRCPATGKTVAGKILYDEREWRSAKYISDRDLQREPRLYDDAVANGYLPERLNLRFQDTDVVAVVASDEATKRDLLAFIATGTALIPKLFSRVFAASEYSEDIAEAGV